MPAEGEGKKVGRMNHLKSEQEYKDQKLDNR